MGIPGAGAGDLEGENNKGLTEKVKGKGKGDIPQEIISFR